MSTIKTNAIEPAIRAELDPGFLPGICVHQAYERALKEIGQKPEPLVIGIERENGFVSRFETFIHPGLDRAFTFRYVERIVKFLLWSRGGWKIHFGGPRWLGVLLHADYHLSGERAFDAALMERVYGRPFTFDILNPQAVPPEKNAPTRLGGHLDGCRIGFDLGASDFKLAAVHDGEAVFSDEIPWDPKVQTDPDYHFNLLNEGLKRAAAHLPRVDAIGGSTAGVVVNNRMMVASLFRSIPENRYETARALFERIQKVWQVPVEVINDGEVTALAGAMSLNTEAVLGMAMGSSEAVGYISPESRIAGWLDELAFAPVDFNPNAPADEWSGDRGVGALYFSQQAVNKLAPAAGVMFNPDLPLPDRLKEVQRLMLDGNDPAASIYRTIGVYLGYTIPWYAHFYDIRHVLVLGRVLSGPGGLILMEQANKVLRQEFPHIAQSITLHLPDEKIRRVGQAVAAASLPELKKRP